MSDKKVSVFVVDAEFPMMSSENPRLVSSLWNADLFAHMQQYAS